MKRLAGLIVLLSMVLVVAAPLSADKKGADKKGANKKESKAGDKKAGAKKPGAKKGKKVVKRPTLAEATLKRLAAAELSEEQQKKIKDIAAEYAPKLQEARKKVNSLITPEQRKARREAIAKAKAAGKKPSDVVTAFKLTPEQAEAQKQVREVYVSFNKEVRALLSPEQLKKIRKGRKGATDKKPKLKKGESGTKATDKKVTDKKPVKK